MHRAIHTVRVASVRLAAACAAIFLLFLILSWRFPLPQQKPYSLVVTDHNGIFLTAFLASDGSWRLKTSVHEIPERLRKILVEKEDRFFYYHPGFNPVSMGRAFLQNIKAGRIVSGASTITMQVARMLEPKERTYWNKLIEIFRALQLEWQYSKDEILEMYLSMAPLGGNIEGLKSASLLYYQTPLDRLNIAQLLDLILIPNDPNGLRPDRQADRLYAARCQLASRFLRSGLLSADDSSVIWQTRAEASRGGLKPTAPHFCLRIKGQLTDASEVRSSLDVRAQKTVEALVTNHLRPWKLRGVRNAAALVLNNRTMEVAAYVGSEDFSDSLARGQVDAVQAVRSPGSTMKPLLYALAMDKGLLTPKLRMVDVPYDYDGYVAENYDGTFSGLVYADEALRKSLNTPMVRLLKRTGLASFSQFLEDLGFASLEPQRSNLGLSMIIGGCGVTLEELTTAFAALARSGLYTRPSYVKNDDPARVPTRRVFSDAAAYMITEILSGLDRPDLPNNFDLAVNAPKIAFKTGTSYGRRDAWCIGYSAEFTAGVWIGNVTNKGNAELVGAKSATPLLIDILNALTSRHQKSILPRPEDVRTRLVCAVSGKLATPQCTHVIEDLYSVTHTLSQFCDIDKEYMVSPDLRKHYCVMCVKDHPYKLVTYQEYPPELLNYWKRIGKAFRAPPRHDPACEQLSKDAGPQVLSPVNETIYLLTDASQEITFQASSGVDVKDHIWYLDSRLIGRKKAGEKFFLKLKEGIHSVSCLDDRGRLSSLGFTVRVLF
jgi:penicillin-binding protein 1C